MRRDSALRAHARTASEPAWTVPAAERIALVAESRPTPERAAREQALRLLARREHSRLELHRKLASRGYADAIAESVVAQLAVDGLQSDERFAQGRVRSAVTKGQGPLKIRADLRNRGVNAEVLAMALGTVTEWSAIARRALAKRFDEAKVTDGVEWARRARFLEARGFSAEMIRETLGG